MDQTPRKKKAPMPGDDENWMKQGATWVRPKGATLDDSDDDAPVAGGARAKRAPRAQATALVPLLEGSYKIGPYGVRIPLDVVMPPEDEDAAPTGGLKRKASRSASAGEEDEGGDPSLHPSGALPQRPVDDTPPAARLLGALQRRAQTGAAPARPRLAPARADSTSALPLLAPARP
jgi:hypothetical protein